VATIHFGSVYDSVNTPFTVWLPPLMGSPNPLIGDDCTWFVKFWAATLPVCTTTPVLLPNE